MDSLGLSVFYNDKVTKFDCAKKFLNLRCSLRQGVLVINEILQHSLNFSSKLNIFHHYHYRILRSILQNAESGVSQTKLFTATVEELFLSVGDVSDSDKIVVQREYLKLVHTIYKYHSAIVCSRKAERDIFIKWFSENTWTLLDKYLLKIFNAIAVNEKLDPGFCQSLIYALKKKGYPSVLLRSTKDFFIELYSSELTPQLQAQALAVVLNTMHSTTTTGSIDDILDLIFGSPTVHDVQIIKGYIKSILADDDFLLLSNLIAAAKLYKAFHPKENQTWPEFLFQLFDINYWFYYFVNNLRHDHKIVVDWLLDGNELCSTYFLLILPEISTNFSKFVDFFDDDTHIGSEERLGNTMSFLIRLNLSIQESNKEISLLIDEIETKYECLGDVPGPDPLSGILSLKFSSQCSIDKCEEEEFNSSGLVVYSDSDSD